jgi:hypothetical protein
LTIATFCWTGLCAQARDLENQDDRCDASESCFFHFAFILYSQRRSATLFIGIHNSTVGGGTFSAASLC